jgi:hypothetical protein
MEKAKIAAKRAERMAQQMGNETTEALNAAPAALNATRTVDSIKAELARLEAAIKKLEIGYWKATADITKRGLQVRVPLIDKDRKVTRKLRPNPSLRLQRAARTAIEGMRDDKQRLLDEIAAIEAADKAAKQKDKFAFLDQ